MTALARRTWWVTLLAVWGCVFFLVGRYFNPNKSPTTEVVNGISWGKVFGGLDSHILGTTLSLIYPSIISNLNIPSYSCSCEGDRSCILDAGFSDNHHIKSSHRSNPISEKGRCTYIKVYVPSPYEEEQFSLARLFDSISNSISRRKAITDYLVSDKNLNQSFLWTNRVADRMKYPLKYTNLYYDDVDVMYLSRFNITRQCPQQPAVTWVEWIEPLSIHARHPFSLLRWVNSDRAIKNGFGDFTQQFLSAIERSGFSAAISQVSLINVDHILIHHHRINGSDSDSDAARSHHSKHSLQKQTVPTTHQQSGRNYMFDVGTSMFESSLWWFTW